MAERKIVKNFSTFKGLDLGTNDLVRSPDYCSKIENWEVDDDGSLILRQGEKPDVGEYNPTKGCVGLIKHVSSSPITGQIQETMVYPRYANGLGILKYGQLIIDYVGAQVIGYEVVVESGVYKFKLYEGGVVKLNFNLGNGSFGGANVLALATAIFGVPNFAAQLAPSAVVNGNQVAGYTAALNVTNVLIANVGDTLDFTIGGVTYQRKADTFTAGTVRWGAGADGAYVGDLSFTNGQVLGIGNIPAVNIPLTPFTTISTGHSIDIPYLAIGNTVNTNFFNSDPDSLFFTPFNGVNMQNSLFIGGKFPSSVLGTLKYDGNCLYRAGMPQGGTINSLTPSAGGAMTLLGTYKYITTNEYKDYNNISIEGTASAIATATLTGANQQFLLNWNTVQTSSQFNARSASFAGVVVNPTSITVTAGHNLVAGDNVYIFETTTRTIMTAQIFSVTNTSITFVTGLTGTFDGAIWNNISTSKTNFYRTKVNSNVFYKALELPNYVGAATSSFLEGKADTALGIEYITPNDGYIHDAPPVMHAVAEHQGSLVGIGDYNNPNAVYYSSPESPEYMDVTNQFDVAGGVQGKLSAIASDTESMLAVFKENAYYNIVGDLITGNFSTEIVSEGSIGCPSHLALKRVREYLMFPSLVGFQILKAGQLSNGFNQRLVARFRNSLQLAPSAIQAEDVKRLIIRKAVAVNDFEREKYICAIPALYGDSLTGIPFLITSYSKVMVFDYSKDAWTDNKIYSSNSALAMGLPYFGYEIFNNKPIWATMSTTGSYSDRSRLITANRTYTVNDFSSIAQPLNSLFEQQWETLGEPSRDKEALQIKAYAFDPEGIAPHAFDIQVETRRNYADSFVTGQDSRLTLSFVSGGKESTIGKFLSNKFRALKLVFTGGTVVNNYNRLTGYEINIKADYLDTDLKK